MVVRDKLSQTGNILYLKVFIGGVYMLVFKFLLEKRAGKRMSQRIAH